MLSLSLSLPRYRLHITLTKRRRVRSSKKFLQAIKNIRAGSRFSRVFRYLFEKKRIKTIFGGNLVLLTVTASLFSPSFSSFAEASKESSVTLSTTLPDLKTKTSIRMPLEKTIITQGFSPLHQAIDLDGKVGDPVYPMMQGRVETVIYSRFALGNHLIIDHGSGIKSVYGHLSEIKVNIGEEVETDQIIGAVGASGMAFGDHLHFEVWENGRRINPLAILPIE